MNPPAAQTLSQRRAARRRFVAAVVALLVATVALYAPVRHFGFSLYDDPGYVVENPPVRQGLSPGGILWALTTTKEGNWHPLTWISHQADFAIFGVNPGAHHLVNLLLHAANTALHLALFYALTGALWPSTVVAALFALHPLHVESVAWISERKDVLSTFFTLAAALAWVGAARRQRAGRSIAVPVLYALALLAKPMPVTLPFVLLLLDWWPLGRWSPTRAVPPGAARPLPGFLPPTRLWGEKLPLFLLAAVSSTVTYSVQTLYGSVVPGTLLPFPVRIANAAVSYCAYLSQAFFPRGLAVFYPHPLVAYPWWRWGAALCLIAGLLLIALSAARRRPYLAVGLLWFLGTLVPAIGIVQVGLAARADRYTYLPLTGVFLAVVWTGADLGCTSPRLRPWFAGAAAAALAGCLVAASFTLAFWRDDRSLFLHAIELTGPNYVAHNLLGVTARREGRTEEAVRHFRSAIEIQPAMSGLHRNLGVTYAEQGRSVEAIAELRKTLELDPGDAEAMKLLGLEFARQGSHLEAIRLLQTAVERLPENVAALHALAKALTAAGKLDESSLVYRKVLGIAPQDAVAENNLGQNLALQGRIPEARERFARAAALDPANLEARVNLARAQLLLGHPDEALAELREILRREPGYEMALTLLAEAQRGR